MSYRTLCGCLESRPEPTPAEFPDDDRYRLALGWWQVQWAREVTKHYRERPECCRTATGRSA